MHNIVVTDERWTQHLCRTCRMIHSHTLMEDPCSKPTYFNGTILNTKPYHRVPPPGTEITPLPNSPLYYQTHHYITKLTTILPNSPLYYQTHHKITKLTTILPNSPLYYQTHHYITKLTTILPNSPLCYQTHHYITKLTTILPNSPLYCRCSLRQTWNHWSVSPWHSAFHKTAEFQTTVRCPCNQTWHLQMTRNTSDVIVLSYIFHKYQKTLYEKIMLDLKQYYLYMYVQFNLNL